jgi:hypothetical protein
MIEIFKQVSNSNCELMTPFLSQGHISCKQLITNSLSRRWNVRFL